MSFDTKLEVRSRSIKVENISSYYLAYFTKHIYIIYICLVLDFSLFQF